MKRFSKFLCCLLLVFSLLLPAWITQAAAASQPPPALTAKGAVLIDMHTGQILFAQNKDARLYPASITKIMTCILALEYGHLDDMVTTSQLARDQDGNRVYLEVGEQEPLRQMLYGLMLNSGNDAAVAIAEHIGGSVAGFAKMMNEKAAELGAKNTHFTNPNGLHDDNHYTTPYDMALIANYAMKNPMFRQLVSTKSYAWHGEKWSSELVNINPMLFDYPGATGVKTGYTDQAQQTMVVSAKHGDEELMAVLMDVQGKPLIHQEATALLDYGFNNFTPDRIGVSGDKVITYHAKSDPVDALLSQDVVYDFPIGKTPPVEQKIMLHEPPAPYPKGSQVGTVEYLANGQIIATAKLLASRDVFPPPVKQTVASFPWAQVLYWLVPAVLLLLLVGLFWRKKRRPMYPTSM